MVQEPGASQEPPPGPPAAKGAAVVSSGAPGTPMSGVVPRRVLAPAPPGVVAGVAAAPLLPLTALAERCGALLKQRYTEQGKPEIVSVFEATTGGLVNAGLQSVPGASRYYHGGANIYGALGYQLYPQALSRELAHGGGRGGSNYRSEAAYQESKVRHTLAISRCMREELGSSWCVAESGATGPSFAPSDCDRAFSAIAVTGPGGVQEVVLVQATHARREENMWSFAAAAFELLQKVLEATPTHDRPPRQPRPSRL
jgi:nicotinamide-nucleotide amidase